MPSNWYPIQATRAYLDLNTADRAAAARCPQCNAHPDSFEFDKDSLAVPLACYGGHSWQIAKAALVPERREQVNHPEHYGGDVPHEVVKRLEAWGMEGDALLWNAVKYIARAGKKGDQIEDLKKAQWYLTRRISKLSVRGITPNVQVVITTGKP